jgi:hypothetical protein
VLLAAQVVETVQTVGSNSTLLGALISGTLIATLYSAYRFVVNFRTTERGMARQRIKQANRNERSAQHEASLWQARAGDLEYIIRSQTGLTIPPLSDELKALVLSQAEDAILLPKWEDATDRPAGEPGK